jgi:hypothetical protein
MIVVESHILRTITLCRHSHYAHFCDDLVAPYSHKGAQQQIIGYPADSIQICDCGCCILHKDMHILHRRN